MKCPRCSAAVATPADAAGLVVCPGCGVRLKRVAAVAKPQAATVASAVLDADAASEPRQPPPSPTATLPPGTARKPVARPDDAPAARADPLAAIAAELAALRRNQEEILALLRAQAASPPAPQALPDDAIGSVEEGLFQPPAPSLRSRRRKSVLLIDDDAQTRQAALEALELAEVPVRTAEDGNAGLVALAQERADVIVLELDVGGAMPGKDMINLVKATMEWVDIPIVLYTRVPIASQRDARTVHGADELVPKDAPRAAEALVAQIVALFRKG
jgi:CheY-like chemotaxis protein